MKTVHTLAELDALPVGSKVIPYGYESFHERGDLRFIGTKGQNGSFVFPNGVCPSRFMGLPASVLDADA